MSGSYKQCSECGKRALSIATRCPQCGHEFPLKPLRRTVRASHLGRLLPLLAVAAAAAAAILLATTVIGRTARAPAEETSSVSVVAGAMRLDTAMAAASPSARSASTSERRFARTWTKVRTRRSTAGDVAAVLLPGDTVLADSLSRGWWRVTLEGEVLGYVHRSTLDTEPPAAGRSPPLSSRAQRGILPGRVRATPGQDPSLRSG